MKVCKTFYVNLTEQSEVEITQGLVDAMNADIARRTPEGEPVYVLTLEEVETYLRNEQDPEEIHLIRQTGYEGKIYEIESDEFVRDWVQEELYEAERVEVDYETVDTYDYIEG